MKNYSLLPLLLFIAFVSCETSEYVDPNPNKLFTKIPSGFSDVTFSNDLTETRENNHLLNDEFITGAGVAVGDINNDGLLDLYFTGNQVRDRLYLNKGDLKFEDITESAGIPDDGLWSTGVSMADVNNDGLLDIYVCKNVLLDHELSKNKLYLNNGDLTFKESAEELKIADKGFGIQSSFFDYDKDGLLDFYLVNQPPSIGNRDGGKISPGQHQNRATTDKLFKKFENGVFHDAGMYAETHNFAYGLAGTVGDLNNDGWQDIYVANDFDQPDHIYFNLKNGKYRDQVNSAVKHISNFSMGVDIADYDNDGLLDIIVVDMVAEDHKRIKTYMGGMNPDSFWETVDKGWHYQYMFNTLQRNNGNGTFADLAQLGGVSNTDWSWSPLLADFDNDGYKDLFVTNGVRRNMRHSDLTNQQTRILDSLEVIAKQEGRSLNDYIDVMEFVKMAPIDKLPNYAFKNNGDLTFTKKIAEWGFEDPTLSNGAAYGDLDNDGDLDLVINNIDSEAGIYRNNTIENKIGNFIRVELRAENFAHIPGTKVRLYKDGELWQLVEITGARGYMSQSEYTAHFGLGNVSEVELVEVEWVDGQYSTLNNVKANQLVFIDKLIDIDLKTEVANADTRIFKEVTSKTGPSFYYVENNFDDYEREVLLPHKMSEFGPTLAVGDVNGDGLEDFYVGGAAGRAASLFVQNKEGAFMKKEQKVFESDKASEDMGSTFFDADGDGDLDLFVASGGNEFETSSKELQDRLYLNRGNGFFTRSNGLPSYLISSGEVKPSDIDKDGDMDLFVAGRMTPGQYPKPTSSILLVNNGKGVFTDATAEMAKEFKNLGMVTSAVWVDVDSNDWKDLVVVGEWMPVTVFINQEGKELVKTEIQGLKDSEGWYYSVAASDMDGDGDEDLVVGNLGLNYKYKASIEEPFEVYSSDFDQNGSLDIVLSYYEHGHAYPVRGRSCSSQQIPEIKEKFASFEAFGDADLHDIYGEGLDNSLRYEASTFASYYIENTGSGEFNMNKLPMLAQTSSVNNIILKDFDQDGNKDILISGNLYQSEIETPRNDAGMGLFMKGDGSGNFETQSIQESGFFAPHDAKSMVEINVNGKPHVLIGNNKYYLQVIEVNNK